ncbi:MAG TPA: UDP-2,3-diacylglucosamine diphosphatase LpxI [Caulobacteraceae bacterium]
MAGGGGLPASLARHCRDVGRPIFVIRLKGYADRELSEFEGVDLGIAQLGAAIEALRESACKFVCLAGIVSRPDLKSLQPDLRGLAALPGAVAAARRGDDGLLSFMISEFEREGFIAEGAHEVMSDLLLPKGPIGRLKPGRAHREDIERALMAARAVGALDAGQGAVVCEGLILALEAQEGTDAMLSRVASLPEGIRGTYRRRRGVLAKACKPGQELRVDLPTLGPGTVRRAAEAGLAGIAAEAGRTLLLQRNEVRALADELALFIVGIDP